MMVARDWLKPFLLSATVNLLIFLLLPATFREVRPLKVESVLDHAIWIRLKPPPPPKPPPPRPKPKRPHLAKEIKRLPELTVKVAVERVEPRLNLPLPRFSIEINPKIVKGVALPPLPTLSPAPQKVEFAIGEVDEAPVMIYQVKPIYPLRAKRANIEGFVRVRFLVDAEGTVREIKVLKAHPKGYFEEAVREAVSRWRFIPGRREGKPVNTWMAVTIRFELRGG